MGILDAPATPKQKLAIRRRPVMPLDSATARVPATSAGLSPEAATTTVTFTTTTPTYTNVRNLTYTDAPCTAHGAVPVSDATFSRIYNGVNDTNDAPWALGFDHYGDHITPKFRTKGTTGQYWIWVDGKPMTAAPVALTGLTAGTTYHLDIDFPSDAWRRLKIYIANLDFQGYRVEKDDGYSAAPPAPLSILWWGDSWFEGASGILLDHFPFRVSRQLGADAFLAAQGGTGYLNAGSGSKSVYGSAGRLEAAESVSPDLIIVGGSVNDQSLAGGSSAAAQAAATSFYAALAEQYPGVPVVVMGVQSVSSGAGFFTNHGYNNTGIMAAAAAAPNVVATINSWSEVWIDGSGRVGSTAGDGNADVMINSADYIHLTDAGNGLYERRFMEKLSRLLLNAA